MYQNKVHIIGIGPGGVSSIAPETLHIIDQAEMLFGGKRLLDMLTSAMGQRIIIRNNLAEISDLIGANLGQKTMAVLASGDPGFYGIARHLTSKLGKNNFEIIPNVSSMQLAFARVKESWDDATFLSVHSRPIEDIIETVRLSAKIGVFTDQKNNPAAISRILLAHGIDDCLAYVCEDLGEESERITETDLLGLSKMSFSPLNILILLKTRQKTTNVYRPGIPDEEFHQRRPKGGLITKLEVRAVSLAKMRLSPESMVWDIGAGSGAVSIEASLIAPNARIFAIERNEEDVAIIQKNIVKFGASQVKVVCALAPDALDNLPAPDVVFIGGNAGQMEGILDIACRRLDHGGRIVINVVTLESMNIAIGGLQSRGFTTEVTLINVSRSKNIATLTRLEALNPVFVISGWRKVENGEQ